MKKKLGLPDKPKINHQIKAAELRVVDEEGRNLGILRLTDALAQAHDRNLDLIEIAPTAQPPVAKIMDFGKYRYLENKKHKLARQRSQVTETKSLQVKLATGEHDLAIKAGKASEFLRAGHRVKIDLFLRGRAKFLEEKFLRERLERLLKFVDVPYHLAGAAQKSPKGLTIIIEKTK